jgi:ubiquitin thioesterase protein OTUB1
MPTTSYEDEPRILNADGLPDMKLFCEHHVEPINKEADHLVISALSRSVGVDLQIAYLDLSGKEEPSGLVKVDFHHFPAGTVDPPHAPPQITLLYKPGHYDILRR